MKRYALQMADGSVVTSRGSGYEQAARRYVRAHGGTVIAWKELPDPPVIVEFNDDPRSISAAIRQYSFGGKRWT